jgi:metal-responsive CopG/Arc/MetJ family transcriptional regulator
MGKKIAKTYSIDDETYSEFDKLCDDNNLNKSKVISKQIEKFINEKKENKDKDKDGDYLLLG